MEKTNLYKKVLAELNRRKELREAQLTTVSHQAANSSEVLQ